MSLTPCWLCRRVAHMWRNTYTSAVNIMLCAKPQDLAVARNQATLAHCNYPARPLVTMMCFYCGCIRSKWHRGRCGRISEWVPGCRVDMFVVCALAARSFNKTATIFCKGIDKYLSPTNTYLYQKCWRFPFWSGLIDCFIRNYMDCNTHGWVLTKCVRSVVELIVVRYIGIYLVGSDNSHLPPLGISLVLKATLDNYYAFL